MPHNITLPSLVRRCRWRLFSCVALATLGASAPSHAAEQVAIEVRERAGIRRFGYPVHTRLDLPRAVPPDTRFRLLEQGKPIPAQFRPDLSRERADRWWLDFHVNFLPYEVRGYIIEYGEGVPAAPEPSGMKVERGNDEIRVVYSSQLEFVVPADLLGMLRSVKIPAGDYLRPGSAGLLLRGHNGERHRVGGLRPEGPPAPPKVTIEGPLATTIRFEGTEAVGGGKTVKSVVDMSFPLSKSWVQVEWTIEDPEGLVAAMGVDLLLNLEASPKSMPTLVDFGATSLVYATLAPGQSALFRGAPPPAQVARGDRSPAWEVLRGPDGRLEPYVAGPMRDAGSPGPEGWAHVLDRHRCTAVAIDRFAREAHDSVEVSSDGRLQLWRDFAPVGTVPPPGPKRWTFWLHFVSFPPHVGAVTSPQSMQSPLEVREIPRQSR